MPRLGRLYSTLQKPTGDAAIGVSVEVRRQGATITSNQSDTSPIAISVDDPGGIQPGDTVVLGTDLTTYDVDSITIDSVTISGFGGTLNVTSGTRISPTNDLPDLFEDRRGNNAKANPLMTSGPLGEYGAYLDGGEYDLATSGGGYGNKLFVDVAIWAPRMVVNEFDSATAQAFVFAVKNLLTEAGAVMISIQNPDGTEVFSIDKDGTITGQTLTVANDLTVPGVLTVNDEADLQNLNVAGSAAVSGFLDATGPTTLGDLEVQGSLILPNGSVTAAMLASAAFGDLTSDQDTADYTATTSYVALPNIAITITPASTSSKFLVLAIVPWDVTSGGGAGAILFARILRDSTVLHEAGQTITNTSANHPGDVSLIALETGLSGAHTWTLEVKKSSAETVKIKNTTDRKARLVVFELQ